MAHISVEGALAGIVRHGSRFSSSVVDPFGRVFPFRSPQVQLGES